MNSDPYYTATEQFLITLNSRNATDKFNGSMNSHVEFDFQLPISATTNVLMMTCSLDSFASPNSIYNINDTNNRVNITCNGVDDVQAIPVGNYVASSFIAAFQALYPAYTVTIDRTTARFTITHSTFDFTINSNSTIQDVIGLAYDATYDSAALVLACPYTCNFNGINAVNVSLDNINTANIDSYTTSPSSVIQSIPLNPYEAVIAYQQRSPFAFKVFQPVLDYIEVSIKTPNNEYVDFNNNDWNMVLVFTVIKDLDRFAHTKTFSTAVTRRA